MESILLFLPLSAVMVFADNVMVVNMPSSNNWGVGMTMDSKFDTTTSPFTEATMAVFQRYSMCF